MYGPRTAIAQDLRCHPRRIARVLQVVVPSWMTVEHALVDQQGSYLMQMWTSMTLSRARIIAAGSGIRSKRIMMRTTSVMPVTIVCGSTTRPNALGALVFEAPVRKQMDLRELAMGVYTVLVLDAEGSPLAQTRLVRQ